MDSAATLKSAINWLWIRHKYAVVRWIYLSKKRLEFAYFGELVFAAEGCIGVVRVRVRFRVRVMVMVMIRVTVMAMVMVRVRVSVRGHHKRSPRKG